MTPDEALAELLAMVGVANGSAIRVSSAELANWPPSAVAAMKSQQLLRKARPADSVVCPGCEESCTMPVNTLPEGTGKASFFVVCDKRDDINRVPVSGEDLVQWRSDLEAVCGFVARALEIRRSESASSESGMHAIGVASGSKRSQMLCLELGNTPLLVAGDGRLPLAELVRFEEGAYVLDDKRARQMVDQSSMADPRYTPTNARREIRRQDTAAMHESWRQAHRRLLRSHPGRSDVWYSQRIEKMGIAKGRKAETIRRRLKK